MARTISTAINGKLVLATTDNPLTITGSGSVTATASGTDAIDGGSGTSWSITNNGAIASSLGYGVNLSGTGSSIFNSGSISGQGAVRLATGGSVTNYASGTIKAIGTSGFSSIAGVQISGSGTVTNYGTISASSTGYGVSLDNGGTVTNSGSIAGGEDGVIIQGAGGQLINTGTITASVDDGVSIIGNVVNGVGGKISSATNSGAGIYIPTGSSNIQNDGSVTGKGYGVYLSAGGSVTNGANSASASLSGGSYGVYVKGAAGTVTNAGTITGASYSVYFSFSSASNKVVVDPGAVFNGAVSGGQGTLELASGVGSIGGVSSSGSFRSFQKLAIDTGGTWTLSGASNSIANVTDNGTLVVTGGLKITTAIDTSSSGQIQLGVTGSSGSLEVASETGSLCETDFVCNGKLIIDNAGAFGSSVGTSSYTGSLLADFGAGDAIQILNFSASGATIAFDSTTGLAQISNGTQKATLGFQASTLAAGSLHLASDGGTGVLVTVLAPPSATVSSIGAAGTGISGGNGDVNASQVVTLTVNFSAPVTVDTTGGTPTLALNDGGSASFTGGSGTTALTFSYTVAAGQNTSDLNISSFNLNGGTVKDGAGNAADLSGATNYNPAGTLQIDTVAPSVSSIVASGTGITNGNGVLGAGSTVTLTVNFSEVVTANTTGGTPTLALNDGGTASYASGSGTTALTFSYTVAAGQNTADLTVNALNPGGATIKDGAGNPADLSGATNFNPVGTLQINTNSPVVSSIAASGAGITNGGGDLNAGDVVTLTVNFSTAVTVNTTGGTPTLILNDSSSASYTGGSGTTALTFSYTVAAGQNTPDLSISSFNLNGATVKDAAGNTADLSGATNYNPAGTLQIDTIAPSVSSIVASGAGITGGNGVLGTGSTVTLTVNFSEPVTVDTTGGAPMLTLNDGGTATYGGGSGSTALTFSYIVAAGQNTSDLTISSFNLNGATVKDAAGNAADLAGATNSNPAGTLQISTPTLVVSSIVASGNGITNGTGDLGASQVVTLTVNFSAAVTVDTTGGAPMLTLNDGGTATYGGGSGSTALTFSYIVAAGQNTSDLTISSFNLNGATVKDVTGNTADLSGATNSNPAGILQIDTTAPVPAFSQEPSPVTSSSTAVFTFTTSNVETGGVSYAYELDGATTWTPVTGNALSLSALANGSHVIQVQATDGAGNVSASPASFNWTIAPAAAQVETQFSGISVTGTYPPNNALAVGPNYVVSMEASRIEWTNLTGGSPTVQSVYNFFSPLGATADNSLHHPRAVFDSVNQRFIMVMDNTASGHSISTIDIAVSKDSNPNDGWYLTALNTSLTINGQLTSADSPKLSVDGTNIYITASQYNVNVSGYAGTAAWVISDTAGAGGGIYNGGTATVVASQVMPSNQGIFTVAAGSNGKAYYASDYSNGSQIVLTLQTYDTATNTFGPSSTIGLGNIDQGGSYTAQQQGTTLLLDAGDNRTGSIVYANGFLYGVAEVKPIGSSVPEVHWFKVDVSNPNAPTLVAQGDISGASIGSNVATFNGSLAVDAAGDVLINFTASGPNMYPADYYVYQKGSDPVGSFSAPVLYQASTGFFDSGNGSSVQPWAGYSSAIVDPNNSNSFWISNDYVASGWWQTSVAQVVFEPAEAPTLMVANSALNVTAGGSVPLGITVTPADPDDAVSVTIGGLASYEFVTDNVDQLTFSGSSITLSAAEVNSGLSLHSNYGGTDHPVNTLSVTASNTTTGEAATSAPQTIAVTDPPATTSNSVGSQAGGAGPVSNPAHFDALLALMDQFSAAGFRGARSDPGVIISAPPCGASAKQEDLASLAMPAHHVAA
jgi:hypothetical protein